MDDDEVKDRDHKATDSKFEAENKKALQEKTLEVSYDFAVSYLFVAPYK